MNMTLEQCLEYAKENSITLKQAKLQINDRLAEELSASGVFLPSVSGYISQSLNSSPLGSDDPTSKYTGSYGVNLSMPVFSGGKNKASLEQSYLNTQIAELSLEEQENSLEIAIAEVFVQMLYAMDEIEVSLNSLELSIKNLENGKVYLDLGSINTADYAQLESAKADSDYAVIVAQTTLSNLQVRLKHLLEISQDIEIVAVAPELDDDKIMVPLSSVQSTYNTALEIRPEIKSSTISIASAELSETIAKAGFLPSLSLSAGAGVSHSSASDFTFSGQLRENFSTSIGASISIPIFSNYQNKTALTKAQNSITSATLALTEAEKDLYQTIESLHNNASNAQAQYIVSSYKLEATEKSLNLVTEQYNLGVKNIIDLLTEQDNYRSSTQDYLVNKYQFILNKALLEYYKTDQIKL
ncbi:MAG: TolC family protein [Rikenellaceae bacterium]